jgi:WD40 repeat protein
LSGDGKILALGDNAKRVSIWDLEGIWDEHRQRFVDFLPLPHAARDLVFSPDGKLVVAGSDDGTLHLLALHPLREVATLTGHEAQVLAVAFSPDGRTLASASQDSMVRLWDVAARMPRAVIRPEAVVWCLAFSPDGVLATGGVDHRVRLYTLPARPPVERLALRGPAERITSFRSAPDGQTLALAAKWPVPWLPQIWDRKTGQPRVPQLPCSEVWDGSVIYSSDSKTVAAPTETGVVLWDVATGRQRAGPLAGDCQAFTPDSGTLATGTRAGEILLWDPATGKLRRRFVERQSGVTCLAYSPDGKTLVSGHADGKVWLWDCQTGARHDQRLPIHRAEVRFLAFSSDRHTLVTASAKDDVIHVWDVAAGQPRPSFTARSHHVVDLGLTPDGKTLAIAGLTRVTLFHVATGQELFSLERHSTSPPSVNFAPDGQTLVTGFGVGGELITWHAPPGPQ